MFQHVWSHSSGEKFYLGFFRARIFSEVLNLTGTLSSIYYIGHYCHYNNFVVYGKLSVFKGIKAKKMSISDNLVGFYSQRVFKIR